MPSNNPKNHLQDPPYQCRRCSHVFDYPDDGNPDNGGIDIDIVLEHLAEEHGGFSSEERVEMVREYGVRPHSGVEWPPSDEAEA